jgi:hydroxypyruvate reductase
VWALLLSDVSGDDPSVIASGPFSHDPTTYSDAIGVLERYGLLYSAPTAVRQRFIEGAAGMLPETPKPGDPEFKNVFHTLVGTNRTAMAAIAEAAKKDGAQVTLLPNFLHGEAHDCARTFCDRLRVAAASLAPGRTAVLIAGGETTVHVWGDGVGGRSQEFALAAGLELSGLDGVAVLAGGTDGIDGPTDAAGAYVDGSTIARAEAAGLDPRMHLADNNSYVFFKTLGDLAVTGPTETNVADLVIGIAQSPPK